MNDLGWTLGWLAVQVAFVMVPALGLHALASRRGPALGAWTATLSLGMVLILGALAFVPRPASEGKSVLASAPAHRPASDQPADVARVEATTSTENAESIVDRGQANSGFRLAWSRLERRAAEPVARLRPWGKAVAWASLAGSGIGLLRLLIGLWAVGLCRGRGRPVDDPAMVVLVEELRRSMGSGPAIELRELPDLATPATAGWLRPMLLLPGDWRRWDDSERRAVVAHELAHVVRGDYAAGLLARFAVALNFYHPMVRWMAGRLHLEQELAADAMGARFAGGRSSYLLALSRLALEQEARPSSWPARAFLPSRGTLIRRIAMLRNEESRPAGRMGSRSMRLATALGLLALTVGVATWKAPATAADDGPSPAKTAETPARAADVAQVVEPFELNYLSDRMPGVVAFRPAAIARRVGMDLIALLIREEMGGNDMAMVAKKLGVDMSRPGFVKLRVEDIEAISCGYKVGRPRGNPKNAEGKDLHTLEFGGVTVRTARPFDWAAFCRQWTIELEECQEARGVFYKAKDPKKAELLTGCVFYQPDPRTVVFDSEAWIKTLIAREVPSSPAFLRGSDWDRASRGLVAIALNNQGDAFARGYDLGRADDAVILNLFKGVDRWVIGVPDEDPVSLRASVTARDPGAAELVARSIEVLGNVARLALENQMGPEEDLPESGVQANAFRMYRTFLTNLKATPNGTSVDVLDGGFGRFAELIPILKAEMADPVPKARDAKANPKAEKR